MSLDFTSASQRSVLCLLTTMLLFAVTVTDARAQLERAYVSRNGNDANACTRNAPCRQINRGLTAVQTNGEVIVLNTGNFQPFTVSKAATVSAAPNASPVILVDAGGTGAAITAPANSVVVLKGLTFRGAFDLLGSTGINGGTSATLHIEGCTIVGFSIGIGYVSSGPLSVKDSWIKSCASGVQTSTTSAVFDNCRIESNGTGLLAGTGSHDTIRNSLFTNNGQAAIEGGGAGTDVTIDGCTVSHNNFGISSDSLGTVVRVANTVVTGNNIGLFVSQGALLSRSPATNTVEGNTTNGAFTGTYSAK